MSELALLIWHFCLAKSLKKLQQTQEQALKIHYDDFGSDYESLSRTAVTSKVVLFVIIVSGLQPLIIITKSSTLDVAAVLDPSLSRDEWRK